VNFVVNYAKNSRLHLSYTEQDIATFIAGLGACRLSILQGMSGTGKTSLPKIFTEAIGAECNIIEVESSWKDKNELIGYYNEFSKEFTPKKFTLALYKATLNQNVPTFIVLDEMNLSRIEYYFSDFLSLMENEEDKRFIKLVNVRLNKKVNGESVNYLSLIDGHTLKISPNVWFIGTANRDESTFVISDKVYDRAHTMNFTKRAHKVMDYTTPLNPIFYSYKDLSGLFAKAKNEQKFNAETNLIIKSVEQLLLPYNISFGNRILNQIEAFVKIYKACFPTKDVEAEAVESILLSKVVAKLEVKTIDNKDELLEAFEKLGLHRCVEFISKLDED
jgi:MoxR-like ATPase